MALVLTNPVLKDGLLTATNSNSWFTEDNTPPNEVLDADILGKNFQTLFEEINGRLCASHFFHIPTQMGSLPEHKVQFADFGSPDPLLPVTGVMHAHDGRDSALLGRGALASDNMKYRSYGAVMCPTSYLTMCVYHGTQDLEVTPSATGAVDILIDVPYDKGKIQPNSVRFSRTFVRVQCTEELSSFVGEWGDWLSYMTYVGTSGGGGYYLVARRPLFSSTNTNYNLVGDALILTLHWVVVLGVAPYG